jgi:hypothetical protein
MLIVKMSCAGWRTCRVVTGDPPELRLRRVPLWRIMDLAEAIIASLTRYLKRLQAQDVDDWVDYRRITEDHADQILDAISVAATQLGMTIFAERVPDDYTDAPVKRLSDTTVLRVATTPAPWARRPHLAVVD